METKILGASLVPGLGMVGRPFRIQTGEAYRFMCHIAEGNLQKTFEGYNRMNSTFFRWKVDHPYFGKAWAYALAAREMERAGFEEEQEDFTKKMHENYVLFVDNFKRLNRGFINEIPRKN